MVNTPEGFNLVNELNAQLGALGVTIAADAEPMDIVNAVTSADLRPVDYENLIELLEPQVLAWISQLQDVRLHLRGDCMPIDSRGVVGKVESRSSMANDNRNLCTEAESYAALVALMNAINFAMISIADRPNYPSESRFVTFGVSENFHAPQGNFDQGFEYYFNGIDPELDKRFAVLDYFDLPDSLDWRSLLDAEKPKRLSLLKYARRLTKLFDNSPYTLGHYLLKPEVYFSLLVIAYAALISLADREEILAAASREYIKSISCDLYDRTKDGLEMDIVMVDIDYPYGPLSRPLENRPVGALEVDFTEVGFEELDELDSTVTGPYDIDDRQYPNNFCIGVKCTAPEAQDANNWELDHVNYWEPGRNPNESVSVTEHEFYAFLADHRITMQELLAVAIGEVMDESGEDAGAYFA